MRSFSPLSDLDALDHRFLDAFAAAAGVSDILVLDTWNGIDKNAGDLPAETDARTAAIYVEWIRRGGRFGLDIDMFGPGMPRGVTRAQFARRLTRALGRPLLLSDCSLFGFSWFKHDPDGAVWEVVSDTNDANNFDLLCDLPPEHPDHYAAVLVYGAHEDLPALPANADEEKTRYCEQEGAAALPCGHFWGACPKFPRRIVAPAPRLR
jgi:hypothetical protein